MIYVVSGLRRSGTSMMMNILYEGGMNILVDEEHMQGDKWNPNGYFEWELFKYSMDDPHILEKHQEKVLKIICSHISIFRERVMPPENNYKVIWMERNIEECVESWRRKGEGIKRTVDPADIGLFTRRRKRALEWLESQSNIRVRKVRYFDVIYRPKKEIENIGYFLGVPLNIEKAIKVVDESLYKVRIPSF